MALQVLARNVFEPIQRFLHLSKSENQENQGKSGEEPTKGPGIDYFLDLLNLEHVPPMPEDPVKRADIEAVLKNGYVALENLLDEEEVKSLKEEVTRMTGDSPRLGRHMFEGSNTVRIYSLLNKSVLFFQPSVLSEKFSKLTKGNRTRKFDKCCLFDRVLSLNNYFLMKGYTISATSTIQINPGEKPQLFHHGAFKCYQKLDLQ